MHPHDGGSDYTNLNFAGMETFIMRTMWLSVESIHMLGLAVICNM